MTFPFPPETLERCLRAMARLDILMTPEEKAWLRLVTAEITADLRIYRVDNGGGDTLTVWFRSGGVLLKGFDHESPLNQLAAEVWNQAFFDHIFAGLPAALQALLDEDEEERDCTTFCMWYQGGRWTKHPWPGNDGGERRLLGLLRETPRDWCGWAAGYYGAPPNPEAVRKVYAGEVVTAEDIALLNPGRDAAAALAELSTLNGTC